MPYTDGHERFVCANPEHPELSWIEQVRRDLAVKEIMLLLDKLDGTELGLERVMREIQRVLDASA